jgi:PhnB protein
MQARRATSVFLRGRGCTDHRDSARTRIHRSLPNRPRDESPFESISGRADGKYRLTLCSGKITHCEIRLGDSVFNLGASMEGWPAHGLVAQIYVEDSDALFDRAVRAGAKVIMPMTDMFFGSREGRIADPFGNVWTIATLKEDVSPAEMQRRMTAEGY